MDRTRKTFFAIVGLAGAGVAGLFALANSTGFDATKNAIVNLASKPPVTVTIATSTTKKAWIEEAADRFRKAGIKTADGTPIAIEIKGVLSGDSLKQITDGQLTPVVWSPGEDVWVDQLREQWTQRHAKPILSQACKPTVYTPAGIGMWRPMAEALGWPTKPIDWKTLVDLAADPQGWGRYGHPQWGRLRLGHTHPEYSSAGLLFLSSVIYGITGETKGLTPEKVYEAPVESALRTLEQNTARYGMLSTDLLDSMAQQGPQFLHAVATFEEGVIRTNRDRAAQLRWPLVFLFPAGGTYWSNHPFCILDGADWVSAQQAEAAGLFRDFLAAPEQQELAVSLALRPIDPAVKITAPLDLASGTIPDARPETVPSLEMPTAATSKAIIDQFNNTKRKATIMLVLDVSGSMNGGPIRAATEATAAFIRRLDPRDQVGLMTFNDATLEVSSIAPVSSKGDALPNMVLNLVASGGTNLNGAVCDAAERIRAKRAEDRAAGDSRVYGIVLLSDGADTAGAVSENRMLTTCLDAGSESEPTKVFAIAFGDQAEKKVLDKISAVSGGKVFSADVGSIDSTYLKISAEQ